MSSTADHSRVVRPVPVSIGPRPGTGFADSFGAPAHACDPNPLTSTSYFSTVNGSDNWSGPGRKNRC